MIQSLLIGKMGVMAQQKRTDVIANNIANVNTVGYKKSCVKFKDALYSEVTRMVDPADGTNPTKGNGVITASITKSFDQGIAINTGIDMDFRIEGNGFFAVQDQNGNIKYTRNGAFAISCENDGNYIVNSQGNYVLDIENNKITIPAHSSISVNKSGEITDEQTVIATFNVSNFPNNEGLISSGNSCFSQTTASGEPILVNDKVEINQGSLENSNVDMAQEMAELLRANRALSFASNAIKTADQMSALAARIRG